MLDEEDDLGKYHKEIQQMPIYKKGWQLMELADKIASLVYDSDEYEHLKEAELSLLQHQATQLRSDAMLICPKITAAEGGDLYDLRMENAAIIRKAARELRTGCNGFEAWGFKHAAYLDVLRAEVDAFQPLFAEWVKTFDPWNYSIDRWGLFNPPGVSYDDKDPDDDLPFTPPDWL